MPGSWGRSRELAPFPADRGPFPLPDRCDSEKRTTQTGLARAHTRRLFPPRGTETCFNTSRHVFYNATSASPQDLLGCFGEGVGQIKEILHLCKKRRVMDGLGLQQGVQWAGNLTFPSPGPSSPHRPQQAEPAPPFLAEGRREIIAESRDPSTRGDVGAFEPSTHRLNSPMHSSSILSPMGERGIPVLPQQTGAQHENLACVSMVPALGGFPVAVYGDQHWGPASDKNPQGWG